jgi:hypothetical protein
MNPYPYPLYAYLEVLESPIGPTPCSIWRSVEGLDMIIGMADSIYWKMRARSFEEKLIAEGKANERLLSELKHARRLEDRLVEVERRVIELLADKDELLELVQELTAENLRLSAVRTGHFTTCPRNGLPLASSEVLSTVLNGEPVVICALCRGLMTAVEETV